MSKFTVYNKAGTMILDNQTNSFALNSDYLLSNQGHRIVLVKNSILKQHLSMSHKSQYENEQLLLMADFRFLNLTTETDC